MIKRFVLVLGCIAFFSVSVIANDMKHDKMDHAMKKTATVKGWVSDSECAAEGVRNCSNKEHVANGAKLVIVSERDGKVYTVNNPESVAEHQGHHIKVNGEIDESGKTITVAKLTMLK